ncbi:hypothetical protein V8H18_01315 [Lautropia mirabilis]
MSLLARVGVAMRDRRTVVDLAGLLGPGGDDDRRGGQLGAAAHAAEIPAMVNADETTRVLIFMCHAPAGVEGTDPEAPTPRRCPPIRWTALWAGRVKAN